MSTNGWIALSARGVHFLPWVEVSGNVVDLPEKNSAFQNKNMMGAMFMVRVISIAGNRRPLYYATSNRPIPGA
ncbi:MAG: hypothetical protein M3Z35_17145 [Nitrospirota bacterium]|nr:hypothetical protein [Nitrospirota bacterium]